MTETSETTTIAEAKAAHHEKQVAHVIDGVEKAARAYRRGKVEERPAALAWLRTMMRDALTITHPEGKPIVNRGEITDHVSDDD